MAINLDNQQLDAIEKLRSGSILQGGVGSGKSRTAIAFYIRECGGTVKINGVGEYSPMKTPRDLYIITTAKKRDSLEWEEECAAFGISRKQELSVDGVKVVVDSWNNISKYKNIQNAFFIFDEQRVVGSGVWVKSFIKIARKNKWILATATPGDTWSDYIPVFVANGFYRNRTEFLRVHAVYSRITNYPKIEKWIAEGHLIKLRDKITVTMAYIKPTTSHDRLIITSYDREMFDKVAVKRWNVFNNKPIKSSGELCYLMRKVVNSDTSKVDAIRKIIKDHPKAIIFYNFDYELEILRALGLSLQLPTAEWNGHLHQSIPKEESWIYLVQYSAGAEGWNCIETDTTIFYSPNYSYKVMVQSAGRTDRRNTPFTDLYYYHIRSNSIIDLAIAKSLKRKKNFNVRRFIEDPEHFLAAA